MELHLNSPAEACFITGAPFSEGDRVVSFLVRDEQGEYARFDCLQPHEGETAPAGEVLCRWTRTFKPPAEIVDHERDLKLTAESLFLSLTEEEPAVGEPDENADLKRFLALMLERKRVLKNRGTDPESGRILYEYMPERRMIDVPGGEMDGEFFMNMRDKLGLLLGEPESRESDASAQVPETEPTPQG